MNVLAIDTASSCSAAVWRDGRIAARRHRAITRGHAEALMPMIEEVLDEARLRHTELDLIAAALGPGSFTGLRTGLAAARGLALALNRPTFGVTSLEAVALALSPGTTTLLVALETKRDDIYAQVFSIMREPLTEPLVCLPDRVPALLPRGPISVAGDAAPRLRGLLQADFLDAPAGDAASIATIAARRFRPSASLAPLTPLYLAPPQAKPQIDGGAVRP